MCFVSFPKVDGVSVKLDKVGKRRKVTARWDTLCFHHPQHCVLQIIITTPNKAGLLEKEDFLQKLKSVPVKIAAPVSFKLLLKVEDVLVIFLLMGAGSKGPPKRSKRGRTGED